MQADAISSEDLNVEGLFKGFYQVPQYQREYIWREENVQRLLDDIYDLWDATSGQKEYFIGSVVTQAQGEDLFDLIDGQQRVTTLYVVMCAIRDRLRELGHEVPPDLASLISSAYTSSETAQTEYRYRVKLQYSDGQELLEMLGSVECPEDIHDIPQRSVSAENIMDAYELAVAWLGDQLDDDPQQVIRFWVYLVRRVKLIRVKTGALADALRVFETINDRGVGLDAMDLLKNLLFIHASPAQYELLKAKWETLAKRLYGKEKPLRFLRYYMISDYGATDLQANKVYDWVTKPENAARLGYQTDPLGFVDRLLEASEAYVAFVDGKNTSGAENQNLVSLRVLAGSARQQLMLLLAGRALPPVAFDRLCKEVEDLFFLFIVTRTPKNVFETSFAKWAPVVRNLRTLDELSDFLTTSVAPLKEAMSPQLDLALTTLGETSLPKYRRKYLLAKLAQFVNRAAYPGGVWADLRSLMDRTFEVEHILPVSPRDDILSSFDKPTDVERYTHRLGNLTLVEKPINASIGNAGFTAKLLEYPKSNLLLTSSLAKIEPVGANTSINTALEYLRSYTVWDSEAIETHEHDLLRIAHAVWGLPPLPRLNVSEEVLL